MIEGIRVKMIFCLRKGEMVYLSKMGVYLAVPSFIVVLLLPLSIKITFKLVNKYHSFFWVKKLSFSFLLQISVFFSYYRQVATDICDMTHLSPN